MRVLLTGANGFIGSHIAAALGAAGHHVVGCGRDIAAARWRFPSIEWVACDFNRDVEPSAWLPRLEGVEAVINCAGVLMGSRRQSIERIHRAAPVALFEACRLKGVRRVLQISALGAEPEADTAYAETKHAADRHLATLDLDWVILKPSLVYASGSYGGTSLLRGLAGFPFVVPIPGGGGQRFQPIHMHDLARGVCRLVEPDAPARIVVDVAGPEPMSLRDIVLGLRAWLGLPEAPVLAVPMQLIRLAGRCGSVLAYLSGRGTLNITAVRQLEFGNVADPRPFAEAVGFTPRRIADALAAEPSHVQDRWHARLYFLKPLLRVIIALFWMATGLLTAFAWPRVESEAMLVRAGLGGALLPAAFWGGVLFDVALGALLLLRWRVKLIGSLMVAATIPYLGFLTFGQPELWAHPLGPVTKTVPLIVATLVMIAIEDDR